MLEKEIEKNVCDYAKEKGHLVYKFTSPNRASVPDRMFVADDGDIYFIEFKAPGKTLTPAQDREKNKLSGRGVSVFVVSDVTHGKSVIDFMSGQ